ncbi:helix-turn-helix domain-containing protein [Wocania ichthyoenteri]|uniref:helix-turn-helix domain-containing protein n=1 Tax=Wocania ichthyoenteri TaxID=1230531 RepID=UPI00053E8547|nr:helix-turn-helix transcriptional regulator [Wocania ichthyoenteri]
MFLWEIASTKSLNHHVKTQFYIVAFLFLCCTDYKSALSGYSNYNKIENGNREISVKELQRLAEFYNITVDQVINLNDGLPKEVVIEDKQAQEQLRLISELDTDDRAIIFKMIDKMLTSKKFKDFFSKNVASL